MLAPSRLQADQEEARDVFQFCCTAWDMQSWPGRSLIARGGLLGSRCRGGEGKNHFPAGADLPACIGWGYKSEKRKGIKEDRAPTNKQSPN